MTLVSISNECTTDNYDLAQWLSINSDDISPTIEEILLGVCKLTGPVSYITVKNCVESTLRRIIYQNSTLGFKVDELIFLMEDAGVQKIIEYYYTDPLMRKVNNETN